MVLLVLVLLVRTKIPQALESPSALRTEKFLSQRFLSSKHSCFSNSENARNRFHTCIRTKTTNAGKELRPIDAFGIVAAVCRPSKSSHARSEGIIGINGKLPWGSLPSDRDIFERLTRDRTIVVGRRTLLNERDGDLDHVRHAKHCIVVSNSITSLNSDPRFVSHTDVSEDLGFLKLARSFEEALDMARDLAETGNDTRRRAEDVDLKNSSDCTLHSNIQCWVAGGERLYEEALQHRSVLELHLSVVDLEIDLTSTGVEDVAMFPAKHRWTQKFNLVNTTSFSADFKRTSKERFPQGEKSEPSFDYHIYTKRIF